MATKRLALELGLVQKRKLKSGHASTSNTKQELDYLVVLDFESTCWENGPRMGRQEIIEFPAVLLNIKTGEIVSEFQQYVMPIEHPILSEFCTNLTGITQDQVEAGMPLGTCLGLFTAWIRKLCDQYQISFNTSVPGKHATFATWSDWDLGVCLHYECNRKQLRKPEFFNQWVDVKITYKDFYQRRPQGLAGALKDLGISFEGREHSGICDARNTAKLISRMAQDGCILKITKSLSAKAKGSSVKEAAQKLFNQVKNVVLGKRPSEVYPEENKPKRIAQMKTSSVDTPIQVTLEVNDKLNSSENVNFSLGLSGLVRGETAPVANVTERKKKTCHSAKFAGPSRAPVLPVNTVKNIGQNKSNSTVASNTSSPKLLNYTKLDPFKTSVVPSTFKTPVVPCTFKTPVVPHTFKTPVVPSTRYDVKGSIGLSKFNKRTPLSCRSSSSNTPTGSSISYHKYKRTPPFCCCGRRAKLLITSKPGPNEGRYFFSCPNGGAGIKKRCKYFKWEEEPFVKTPLVMNPFCTPVANLNRKFTANSLPLQRVVRDNGAVLREAASEPGKNNKFRCIGLSRNFVSPNNMSNQKIVEATPNAYNTNIIAHQVIGDSRTRPYEVTPFIVKHESRLK